MTDQNFDRFISFEEVYNFRDMGGYRTHDGRNTRWGRLFRSGELHLMTSQDVMLARDNLRVNSVIDLRDPKEVARFGLGSLFNSPIKHHNVSVIQNVDQAVDQVTDTAKSYLRRMRRPDFWDGVLEVLRLVAEPEVGPVVMHCSLGKDRTGMVGAIILGTLGVVDEDIIEDYALSNAHLDAIFERMKSDPERTKEYERVPPVQKIATSDTMRQVVNTLKGEYDSMLGFAQAHGVDNTLLRRLEDSLLD